MHVHKAFATIFTFAKIKQLFCTAIIAHIIGYLPIIIPSLKYKSMTLGNLIILN